ncbi:3-oxoacyl-[acyl-carrier protein] reductase [Acidisarcina polymorpha]|uniref:3-oxoacyl-[acyl-carrier protein] reductase n=1 Tax=Acidisarcina polymorpha TaxID=2211140 RepID=A0A2Z5G0S8_9BACT|nr:SDR family NAD(P)-dependent oxidoreductase [Acidisarcina polymorpha]AXC12712.1 3-oxoacyl-[acyl-carrier protein] reductase [Acidisarcina polymorpha]
MSKVWLVTGCASGLGRDIAEAVLASGDRLMATARDPHRLNNLVKQYGEQVQIAALDVADEAAAKAAVEKTVHSFGRLDVVVNNAGYGDVAPFEQLSSESFRALIETNFFGVVYMTRAAIPIMRTQKSGCILQISSVGGRLGVPGNAGYHAAKWAVGGFTEALAPELAPFGVTVCAVEPGGIRTNWGKRATAGAPELFPDYEASVGTFLKMLQEHWGHEMSAPAKVAQVILQLASKEQLPAHLLLGSDAVQYARFAEEKRESDARAWHNISVSTDAENVKGLPDLKF